MPAREQSAPWRLTPGLSGHSGVLDAKGSESRRLLRVRRLTGRGLASVLALALAACGGRSTSEGGAATPGPSCRAGAPGADKHCGASGDVDCCGWSEIPGGTFNRLNNLKLPATVSPFKLDLLEVTVGRFRAFVDAYPASRPQPGDGKNPHVPGSGWRSEWDARLPPTRADLMKKLHADIGNVPCPIWTDHPGANETVPIECVTWYEAFAFCAWDGGRLPTVAEWDLAAAGGTEQRTNPWGNHPYDPSRAVYYHDGAAGDRLAVAGSRPAGAARWGQLDMGGSRLEWVFDTSWIVVKNVSDLWVLSPTCSDCAEMSHPDTRLLMDLSYHQAEYSVVERIYYDDSENSWQTGNGIRCVYSR